MAPTGSVKNFFFPRLNRAFLLRLLLVAGSAWLIFSFLLIPLRVEGISMEPTYHNGSFAFCWRLPYFFAPPQRGDVVTVRFSGRDIMLLKRIVALEGDTVAFDDGQLLVNGQTVHEPYVSYRHKWQLDARTVAPGHVYVVGDNRGMAMQQHKFGQVDIDRVIGGVIP